MKYPVNAPWSCQRRSKKTDNLGIYDSTGTLMASIEVHQLAKSEKIARQKFEGTLMAHAPDLMKSLADLVEACSFENANGTPFFHAAVQQARNAIENAKGTT